MRWLWYIAGIWAEQSAKAALQRHIYRTQQAEKFFCKAGL